MGNPYQASIDAADEIAWPCGKTLASSRCSCGRADAGISASLQDFGSRGSRCHQLFVERLSPVDGGLSVKGTPAPHGESAVRRWYEASRTLTPGGGVGGIVADPAVFYSQL